MRFHLSRASRALAAACLAIAGLAGSAAAAEFNLNPTRVHLDRARSIETLVLGNADQQRPVSFEVSVKRWTMAADGSWQLQPSDDLVVHPLVFTVQAGEQARLRVGTLDPAIAAEQAYRIELQQLPGGAADNMQVELLTRISVPVFVQPAAATAAAALEDVSLDAGGLRLVVVNTGARYLPPQEGRLRWLGADDQALGESLLQTGYILVGGRLPLSLPEIPAGACMQARRLELQLPEAGGTLVASLPAGPRRCGG